MTQGTTISIIGGEAFADTPMQGEMIEADFEKNTIILRMTGRYYAQHGTFMLIPFEEWEKLTDAAKEPQSGRT